MYMNEIREYYSSDNRITLRHLMYRRAKNLQLLAPIDQLVTGIQTRDLGRRQSTR